VGLGSVRGRFFLTHNNNNNNITISFMQIIYTYIPETNNVPKEYNVAAILSLLFMVPISLLLLLLLLLLSEPDIEGAVSDNTRFLK
jgi:short subunit fatty acids transporter